MSSPTPPPVNVLRRGAAALVITTLLIPAAAIAAPRETEFHDVVPTTALFSAADDQPIPSLGAAAQDGPRAQRAAAGAVARRAADSARRPAGAQASRSDRTATAEPAVATQPPPLVPARDAAGNPTVFASVAGQELVLPADVRKVGFHESGDRRTLAMSPKGTREQNLNDSRIALPQQEGDGDASYLVLPTRGRAPGPTTAVDISVDHGEQIQAVVSGTVKTVTSYNLYGRTPDMIVEIVPDDRPEMVVRMLHIEDVQVSTGDTVEAGETVIAESGRQLPFRSQIDRFAGAHPHVHVEVQHRK
jgi:hypothetical protein